MLTGQIWNEMTVLETNCKTIEETEFHYDSLLVQPKHDESLSSWIIRQAWAFHTSPGHFLRSEHEFWKNKKNLPLIPSNYKNTSHWINTLDIVHQSVNFYTIFSHRGLHEGGKDLHLSFNHLLDFSYNNFVDIQTLLGFSTLTIRYCPKCWKNPNSRYFKKIWRYPFIFSCLEHGCELLDKCPSCKANLFSNLHSLEPEHLFQCPNCDINLVETLDTSISSLLTIQKKIIENLLTDELLLDDKKIISKTIYGLEFTNELIPFLEKMKEIIGSKGVFGFENAKGEMLRFVYEQKCLPKLNDKRFRFLFSSFANNSWTFLKIRKWNDIMLLLFDSTGRVPKFFCGKRSYSRALKQIQLYKTIYRRIPKPTDKEMIPINRAIMRYEWNDFEVRSWSDILKKAFPTLKINSS